MAYQFTANRGASSSGLGQLGCGPSCNCRGCSSHSKDLGEVYERDEDDLGYSPRFLGYGETGYGADLEVTEPGGRVCRAAERRIHPIIEPPPNLLVPVPAQFTA